MALIEEFNRMFFGRGGYCRLLRAKYLDGICIIGILLMYMEFAYNPPKYVLYLLLWHYENFL